MAKVEIPAKPRSVSGKKVRFLRREGYIPANLYGGGIDASVPLQIESKMLVKMLANTSRNVPVTLVIDGRNDGATTAFVWGVQHHPVTGDVLHVDFRHVDMTQRMRAQVPIVFKGQAPAVKYNVGMIAELMNHLEVECLPGDLPEKLEVDLALFEKLDQELRVKEVSLGPSVRVLTDAEQLIVKVVPIRIEKEEVTPAAEVAPAEGEAPATAGEAPAAAKEGEAPAAARKGEPAKGQAAAKAPAGAAGAKKEAKAK